MVRKAVPTIQYRRKRDQKTDYKQRLNLLKGRLPRLTIRKSLQSITLQLVEYHAQGDKVLAHVTSKHLGEFGMKVGGNIPCAYLTGILLAKKAKELGISKAVVDLGLQRAQHSTRLFAAAAGATDGGLDVSLDTKAAPDKDRLYGKHIDESYPKMVEDVKSKILQ